MPRDWMSDEEKAAACKEAKWLRIDAWAYGFAQAAMTLIVLRAIFS